MSVTKFHHLIIFIALIVYCITAYNSHGYFQYDEHYQIIEFARLKLGLNQPQDLAWEYHAQMRSAFQPFIVYCIFKVCYAVNISDPYTLAFLLRLLTGLFAIFVISKFVKATLNKIDDKYKLLYIFSSYLLWFLPFINVRFTGETMAGLFFLWSLSIFLNIKNDKQYYLIGLLLGITYLFRFQTGILVFTFLLWLIIIHKEKWSNIFKTCSIGIVVALIGVILDYWLYNSFTFSVWNYLVENNTEKIVKLFGGSPWYGYFPAIIFRPTLLIGIPLFLALIYLLFTEAKNLFVWLTVVFLIVHSLIPHKEYRFLFPLINTVAFILFITYQSFTKKIFDKYSIKIPSFIVVTYLVIVFLINTICLAAISTEAADSRVAISRYLHKTYPTQPIKVVYTKYSDFFTPELPAKFYEDKNATLVRLDSLPQLNSSLIDTTKLNFFVLRKGIDDIQNTSNNNLVAQLGYKKIQQSSPQWIAAIGIPSKMIFEWEILELYQKK